EAAASTSTSATSSATYDSGGNLLSSTSSGSRSLDLELRYARPVIPSRSGFALQAPVELFSATDITGSKTEHTDFGIRAAYGHRLSPTLAAGLSLNYGRYTQTVTPSGQPSYDDDVWQAFRPYAGILYTPTGRAPLAVGINPAFQTYVRYKSDGTIDNHGTRTTLQLAARTDRPPAWSDHGYLTAFHYQIWRQTLDASDVVRWKYGYRRDFISFTPAWERGGTTLAAGAELYNTAETTEDGLRTPTRITTNAWTGLALRLGVETRIMSWLRLQAGVKQFAELKANRVTTSPATDQTNTTTLSTYTRFYGGAGVDVAGWAIDLSLPSASSGTKEITYQTNEKDVSGSSSASLSLTARRSF
ncbi:MAG: hypothetical protein AB1609_15425, partial [Bacillota bacterium]